MRPIDAIQIPEVLSYVRARTPRRLLGASLFPARDISSLEWKAIIGADRAPVAAKVVAFDNEASIHSREGVELQRGKIPAIKRKISLDEETMQKLYSPRPSTSEFEDAIREIYADVEKMIVAVETRLEMFRFEALTTGQVNINEDGVIQQVQYGFRPANQAETLAGNDRWSESATCSPIADIQRWRDAIMDLGGVEPARALTSSAQLNNILRSDEVSALVHGVVGTGLPVTNTQLNSLLVSMGLPQIATYDDRYRIQNENGTYTQARYLANNRFILMPGQALGEQLYSPTVEALRKVRDGVINYGDARRIYAEVWEENEPPAHWTKAAALSFPTFPLVDSIFVATVAD